MFKKSKVEGRKSKVKITNQKRENHRFKTKVESILQTSKKE